MRNVCFIICSTRNVRFGFTFCNRALITLEEGLIKYFPDFNISNYDWTNDLFDRSISFLEYSLQEKEELSEIRNEQILLSKYKKCSIYEFWIHVEKMYANGKKKENNNKLKYLINIGISLIIYLFSNI